MGPSFLIGGEAACVGAWPCSVSFAAGNDVLHRFSRVATPLAFVFFSPNFFRRLLTLCPKTSRHRNQISESGRARARGLMSHGQMGMVAENGDPVGWQELMEMEDKMVQQKHMKQWS